MFQIKSSLLQKVFLSDLVSSHYSDSLKHTGFEHSLKDQRKCHSDRSLPIRYCFAIYMTSITQIWCWFWNWQCVLDFYFFFQHYRQLWSAGSCFGYVERDDHGDTSHQCLSGCKCCMSALVSTKVDQGNLCVQMPETASKPSRWI